MKAQDLRGSKLAMWVALALGYRVVRDGDHKGAELCVYLPNGIPYSFTKYGWRPDLDGAVAQPIIEKERISTLVGPVGGPAWVACVGEYVTVLDNDPPHGFGQTALIAAMRAFVASKYGYEDLPKPAIDPQ